jgi:hypothetical protein
MAQRPAPGGDSAPPGLPLEAMDLDEPLKPEDSDDIPPLNNITPSIFIPLVDDLTEQSDPPRDRIERLRWIIQTIDTHKAYVTQNIMYMLEREKERVTKMAKAIETKQGIENVPRLNVPPQETDHVIAMMEAPAQPGVDYNFPNINGPGHSIPPLTQLPGNATPRDATFFELASLVNRGVIELSGYHDHINNIRAKYAERLRREIGNLEEAGKRPEERAGYDQMRF